jgi:antitoxin (DNA-binding transcriptional repressor) of toxin-antitoxin stability system
MRDRREKILADPEGYRRDQIDRRLPDDFEHLTEEEQQEIVAQLEDVVASADPAALRDEIARLTKLIDQAKLLEQRQIESKLTRLRTVLQDNGFFADPKKKLLVFTEHKDSLDFLAGDGRDGRPLGKLREWGLAVTVIHGSMKIGPRGVRRLAAWETLLSVTTCDYHTGAMKAVGVKQLKARLSEYVRLVRAGATILVTDRDEVVAELRPARRQARPADDLDDLLDRLADAGEVTRASLPPEGWTWRVRGLGLPPGTAQTLLDELRADGAMR